MLLHQTPPHQITLLANWSSLVRALMRLSIIRVKWEICCWPADDCCRHVQLHPYGRALCRYMLLYVPRSCCFNMPNLFLCSGKVCKFLQCDHTSQPNGCWLSPIRSSFSPSTCICLRVALSLEVTRGRLPLLPLLFAFCLHSLAHCLLCCQLVPIH